MMKYQLTAIILMASIAPVAAQDSQPKEIYDHVMTFSKAFNAKDAAAIADFYAEDAIMFPPGEVKVVGHENIKKFWQGAMAIENSKISLVCDEVKADGNLAFDTGTFTFDGFDKASNKVTSEHGKFVVVWVKQDGVWKMHRDMWNANPVK